MTTYANIPHTHTCQAFLLQNPLSSLMSAANPWAFIRLGWADGQQCQQHRQTPEARSWRLLSCSLSEQGRTHMSGMSLHAGHCTELTTQQQDTAASQPQTGSRQALLNASNLKERDTWEVGQWEKSTHNVHVKSHSKANAAKAGRGRRETVRRQRTHVQRPRAGEVGPQGSTCFSMGVEVLRTQDKDAPFRQ